MRLRSMPTGRPRRASERHVTHWWKVRGTVPVKSPPYWTMRYCMMRVKARTDMKMVLRNIPLNTLPSREGREGQKRERKRRKREEKERKKRGKKI